QCAAHPRDLHSFPTRRSSDLTLAGRLDAAALGRADAVVRDRGDVADRSDLEANRLQRTERALAARTRTLDLDLEGTDAMLGGLADRKSTRLNSSHVEISYAVF